MFRIPAVILVLLLAIAARPAGQVNVRDTRLVHQPATSGTHVAFVYADDLWVSRIDGSDVRRLTTDDGVESSPAFSPDGKLIAFTAQYDGNPDVYVVPTEGGVPKRLTWHPGQDEVQGFTPDGRKVLFTSGRAVFTNRYTQLFTVAVDGGVEEPLPIPNAASGAYSPDGRRIAYNPLAPRFEQWKRYRGGTASRIWLYDTTNQSIEKVPQPASRANDVDAAWIGPVVYFRSDRNGEFNIFSFDSRSNEVRQLTTHDDFPVLSLAAGGGKIVYEQAGYLHLLDPGSKSLAEDHGVGAVGFARDAGALRQGRQLDPRRGIVADRRACGVRVPRGDRHGARGQGRCAKPHQYARCARALAGMVAGRRARGLFLRRVRRIRAARGAARRPGRRRPGIGWAAPASTATCSGPRQPQGGLHRQFAIDLRPRPEDRRAAQGGLDESLWTGEPGPFRLVARLAVAGLYRQHARIGDDLVGVFRGRGSLVSDQRRPGGSERAGVRSERQVSLSVWFDQCRAGARLVCPVHDRRSPDPQHLPGGPEERSPVATGPGERRREAEDGHGVAPGGRRNPAADAKPAADEKAAAKPPEPVRIDFPGIEYRILDLPVRAGDLSNLQAGDAGQLFYLRASDDAPTGNEPPRARLHRFDLAKRQDEQILESVRDYRISADAKKLLYAFRDAWSIVALAPKVSASEGRLAVADLEVRIDPRAEWAQIFDEAWRVNRDYFYAPNMHGADWPAMRKKYAALLPDVAVRSDVNRLIQWMSSELSVGHHRGGGGDRLDTPKSVPGGLLGADYSVENGRYRFKKVYGGLNWNPQLRSPLTEPGVNVRAGEYLLAVRGQDVRPPANVYSFFENTAGKIVEITVGPNPDGTGSRKVQVVPAENEGALRNRDWVEGNLRKVDAATGGRVAYVYVPNTAEPGYTYFKRYFYPQTHKDAVIVDERFNGGGQVADYYIDLLRRPLVSYWAMRYGDDLKTPAASIQGPKVMIIDETAGSGGDLLPWMFRKFAVGKIVGQRTWGGLVGILGFPTLMDGGTITAPNLAIWTAEDGWVVENEGVPPDIEVEQTPRDVIAGRDPQLERAIAVALEELKKNPPATPKRPPYPNKTLRGTTTTSSGSPRR